MSLSSFLEQSDVRARFRQEFSKPKLGENRDLLAPPLTGNYRLVGTAFDYLMRFYLKMLNPQAVEAGWIAEITLNALKRQGANRLYQQALFILTQARENYTEFLKSQEITDDLISSTLQLAKLDVIYRARRIDPNLQHVEPADIEDIKALINLVKWTQFKTEGVVVLNPTFGLGSVKVREADADLVIDDLLIDIKTTKNFKLEQDNFNQLMGYYTLSKIDAIDGAPPGHEIKRLGIYFSRHAYLFIFNVADVVPLLTFSKFLEWFQERAAMNDY
jgi:hypothetical protein